jgi:hypothetical protein
MQWYSRISRFGDLHMVYGQKWANSCGLASTVMCAFKMNKFAMGQQAVYEEQKIKEKYEKASGSPYDPKTQYTDGKFLQTVLSDVTGKNWALEWYSEKDRAGAIIDSVDSYGALALGPTISSKCCIVLARWGAGGAHWVVVDSVRSAFGFHWATICDPWDTNLHIVRLTKGQPIKYDAADVSAGVDIGSSGSQASGGKVDTGVATRTATYAGDAVVDWIIHVT